LKWTRSARSSPNADPVEAGASARAIPIERDSEKQKGRLMLRVENRVRLTADERRALIALTGAAPPDQWLFVNALNGWIDVHLGLYPGRFPEEQLLRRMLESFRPDGQSGRSKRSWASQ
jgi:hypothetical protein